MNTPLDLETSRAIFDLIGDYETEYSWKAHENPMKNEYFGWTLLRTHDTEVDWDKEIPAPTFAELIRVLPRIGEKLKWNNKETAHLSHVKGKTTYHTTDVSMTLADKYMYAPTEPEGMKEVEAYLEKLLK